MKPRFSPILPLSSSRRREYIAFDRFGAHVSAASEPAG